MGRNIKREKVAPHLEADTSNDGFESADIRSSNNAHFIDPQGSLHVLSHDMKTLIQGVQKLRQLGVEDLNLPLPKIVVVGDQSTGKSSLIEGMSEIQVPRSTGTCTRCPLEINLTENASQWTCQVSLCKKYVYDGLLGTPRKGQHKLEGATRLRPLGRWVQQDMQEFHFHTIEHKDDVPAVLRLAQLATLNPGTSHDSYRPGHIPAPSESIQVKFSPNVIRLDIAGPNLPNLAFYDLPGVINVSDVEEETYLVDLVRNLVKEYVQCKDSINLLALPMTDDPANSSALRLIRELKAESRTVGCLTKPDRFEFGAGSLDQWIQLLQENRFRLGHGYFVVKNDPDPHVDHKTARKDEMLYFETVAPWTTDLRNFSGKFGTSVLQSMLSQTLTSQIRKSLPRIQAEIQRRVTKIDAQIRYLPEPVQKNAPLTIMMELVAFERELLQQLDGGGRDLPFQSEWNELAMKFRQRLAETKPLVTLPYMVKSSGATENPHQFKPTTPSSTTGRSVSGCIDLSSDSEETAIPSGSKRPARDLPQTPTKSQRTGGAHTASHRFKLAEIKSIIQSAYTGGIPSLVHPNAIEEIIKRSMVHWEDLICSFLNTTEQHGEQMINGLAREIFRHRQGTAFYEELMDMIHSHTQGLFNKQRSLCAQLLKWESEMPKTLNEAGLASARNTAFDRLKCTFNIQRAHDALDILEKKNGKPTSGQARTEKATKLPESQLGPDKYDLELQALSNVKGYYEVAYSRFVDVVCSSIQCECFKKCRNELVASLREHFDVAGPDANQRLMKLLQASSEDQALRDRLVKEKATLAKAQDCIQRL